VEVVDVLYWLASLLKGPLDALAAGRMDSPIGEDHRGETVSLLQTYAEMDVRR
jgi:hypothetical protein